MFTLLNLILALLFCSTAYAADPPPTLYDEGVKQGVIFNFNCVGDGVTCSRSGINGTLNIAGAGGGVGVGTVNPGVTNAVSHYISSTTLDDSTTLFDVSGNIGLGTTVPLAAFVVGSGGVLNTAAAGDVYFKLDLEVDGGFYGTTGAYSGLLTAANLSGTNTGDQTSVTGNAGTATALAANGSNCSAGNAPLGVDASGAVESCTDYEEDLSNSAGLRSALSDENGTGVALFDSATSPTFAGTIVGSISGNAATVTTNANLTGPITSTGNATALAAQTGTGSVFVVQNTPTLTTPVLGVATATSIAATGNVGIAGAAITGQALRVGSLGTANQAASGDVYITQDLEVDGAIYDAQGIQGRCVQYGADGMHVPAAAACGTGGSSITAGDTQVIFADGANSPAGDAGMTYNKTTDALTVAGNIVINGSNACRENGTNCPVVGSAGGWTDDGTVVRLGTSTDNVGIGTVTTPAKLTVGIAPSMNLIDGANDVLVKGDIEVDGNIYSGTGTVNNILPSDTGSMYVQNKLEVDGGIYSTVGNFSGIVTGLNLTGTNTGDQTTVTGNAGTATALAADPANCASSGYAGGITAAGTAEACTTPGTGVTTFITTPTTANFAAAVTGETGSGAVVFGTAPTVTGLITDTMTASGNVGIGTTNITTTALYVGSGTGTLSYAGSGDVYIRNDLEVDGMVYAGAGIRTDAATGDTYINAAGSGNVGIGKSALGVTLVAALDVDGAIYNTGDLISTDTGSINWSFPQITNQACNTTCINGCVGGVNITAGNITGVLLVCTDTTADQCICAGQN